MFAKYLDFVVSVSGTPNTSILVDYHTQESFRSSWSRMSVCKYDINEIILLKNLSFQNSAQKKKLRDFHLQDSGGTRFCTKSKIMRPPLMQRRWCKIVTNSMDDFQKKSFSPSLLTWRLFLQEQIKANCRTWMASHFTRKNLRSVFKAEKTLVYRSFYISLRWLFWSFF